MMNRRIWLAFLLLAVSAPACSHDKHTNQSDAMHGHHNHHAGHHHDFSGAEEWAKRFDSPERDAWQRPADVIAAMQLEPGMTVADLGAGTGYFLPHLSRAVGEQGRVWGLDPEPDMVRYMKERAAREGLSNVDVKQIPIDDPGVDAASLDRILIVNTWHHIEGRPAYAAKLAQALKPGGSVIIVDYTKEAQEGPPPAMRLDAATVIAELQQGGLTAELVPAQLPRQYIIRATRP
jgi:ubiquinone/menaquinone biosynthesis C-methylase UbiE